MLCVVTRRTPPPWKHASVQLKLTPHSDNSLFAKTRCASHHCLKQFSFHFCPNAKNGSFSLVSGASRFLPQGNCTTSPTSICSTNWDNWGSNHREYKKTLILDIHLCACSCRWNDSLSHLNTTYVSCRKRTLKSRRKLWHCWQLCGQTLKFEWDQLSLKPKRLQQTWRDVCACTTAWRENCRSFRTLQSTPINQTLRLSLTLAHRLLKPW